MGMCAIVSFSQVQNLDFENWETDFNRPSGWECAYYYNPSPVTNFYFPPETNAQSNNFALKICLWYMYVEDMAIQKASIDYRPSSLQGHYKYEQNLIYDANYNEVIDTAAVSVYLTKWNTTTVQRDTIGTGILEFGEEKTAYTAFTNPITYINQQVPDSIIMIFEPSKFPVYTLPGTNGVTSTSFFTIDNLSLTQGPLTNAEVLAQQVALYPNPTNANIRITNFTGTVSVYTTAGKKVLNEKEITLGTNELGLKQLPPGVYLLKLQQQDQVFYKKVVRE
ncbi:hypothetical protein NBRC110019_16370 [Neptunitalea chrysea]|uniref:Secretion system C-terminal sorting domain-containing protein n=2 Tax=Neptunitalea chrysea TaxID=1647581 RepID=A0A9W6EVK0_9FLAO|nr:hypothetical protein NBRC110019_16370 [Neptunitalea chrysea]